MAKFFRFAFGENGDRTPVPDEIQPTGAVSYSQGYGPDYQLPDTDPDYKDVEGNKFNQLLFDVTGAVKEFQTQSVPLFITAADNGGVNYSYNKGVRVFYDAGSGLKIYESLVASNNVLPTDATKWRLVNDDAQTLILSNATFEGSVVNGDAVYFDGTVFAKAQAVNTGAREMIGIANVTDSLVYLAGVVNGLSGLTPGAVYYLSGTAGQLTTILPVVYGVKVGVAKTSSQLLLNITPINSNLIAFKGVPTSAQLFNAGSSTVANLQSAEFDTTGILNTANGRVTPTVSGYYHFAGSWAIASVPNNGGMGLLLRKNGSIDFDEDLRWYSNGGADTIAMEVGSPIYCNGTTDYVELVVRNRTVSNLSTDMTIPSNFLAGWKIG